jgi:putative transposase
VGGRQQKSCAAKLCVALAFRHEVVPIQPRRLLVVDFDALHDGVARAVVGEEKIVGRGILRPHMSKNLHLQKIAARLESLCAKKDKACDEASAVKSRIWRILQTWEDEAAKKLLQLALTSVNTPKPSCLIRRMRYMFN